MSFNFVTDMIHQESSIITRSTFHHFSATPSSRRGRLWGGFIGVKPRDQSEMAERLITVETSGKHVLQRGAVTGNSN